MASRFSGALQLTDLDDFITPSQVTYSFLLFCFCFTLERDIKALYYSTSDYRFCMYTRSHFDSLVAPIIVQLLNAILFVNIAFLVK